MDGKHVPGPTAAARFRALALARPHAVEQPHFDAASFRVGGKIFAQLTQDGLTGLVKLPPPVQDWAVSSFPAQCSVEPHWGRHGWTRLVLADLPAETIGDLIETSWRMVAPTKLHPKDEGRQ